jgi:hypothetical protein
MRGSFFAVIDEVVIPSPLSVEFFFDLEDHEVDSLQQDDLLRRAFFVSRQTSDVLEPSFEPLHWRRSAPRALFDVQRSRIFESIQRSALSFSSNRESQECFGLPTDSGVELLGL